MMKYWPIFPIIIYLCTFISACEDVFEKDIQKDTVVLIAPSNNVTSTISSQTFMWKEVDGASYYIFQIVTPSFDSIQKIIVEYDTTGTKINHLLKPGKYQWRVKAYNSGYETQFTTFSIKIDSTFDISKETIELISPADSAYFKDSAIKFEWTELYNALSYFIEVRLKNKSGNLVSEDTFSTNTCKLPFEEGEYSWMVKAMNKNSSTDFSEPRIFIIDRTPPEMPELIYPAKDSVCKKDSITFYWANTEDDVVVLDSFYIFDGPKSSSSVIYKSKTTKQKLEVVFTQPDTIYYWAVKSIDKAGNIGDFSLKRAITFKRNKVEE